MPDLSILIPARNEMFLSRTIQDILEHIEGDTEIIAVLDGAWADPPIEDYERVVLVHHSESIGQRAATNEAAKLSAAKFIMKVDAHCSFSQGFDVALMEDCQYDWTMVPEMRNLHAFDWKCQQCGHQMYQGPYPEKCKKCDNTSDFEMTPIWKPRSHTRNRHMLFDSDLHFQYWRKFKKRPEARGKLVPTMSLVGACWMMDRERYWELGGMDERHGSWGQMGTEIACKTWLSGGQLICSRKAWFAHLFRTQSGFRFPYPLSGSQVNQAREHSRWLWNGNNWEGQKYPLSWLLEKFWPIPGWTENDLQAQKESESNETGKTWQLDGLDNTLNPEKIQLQTTPIQTISQSQANSAKNLTSKGIVYYTDNRLDKRIFQAVQFQITNSANGHEIVSVSLQPIEGFGRNIVVDENRGILTMFRQILAGLEASTANIVFFCEHDILYHPSHFEFVPPRDDVFYYNNNLWRVDAETGHALFHYSNHTSQLCAYRSLLLEHYRKRVALVEEHGFTRRMGFEPGTHGRAERVDDYGCNTWVSEYPNIDIRHKNCLTPSRWKRDQFRNQRYTKGWTESSEVPGWGRTEGCFEELLNGIIR